MILKELQGKELLEAKEKELRRALKQYRIDVGMSSPFQVSKELGMGKDTVYKYEKGTSIPTLSKLNMLIMFYGLDKIHREYLLSLREEIIRMRRG